MRRTTAVGRRVLTIGLLLAGQRSSQPTPQISRYEPLTEPTAVKLQTAVKQPLVTGAHETYTRLSDTKPARDIEMVNGGPTVAGG